MNQENKSHEIFTKSETTRIANVYINKFDNSLNIQNIYNELRCLPDNSTVNLYITSPGGSVNELLNFKNILLHEKTLTVNTFLTAGYSCGALIFTFGKTRAIYEDSVIMFHTFLDGVFNDLNHIKDSEIDYKIAEKFITKCMKPYFTDKEINMMHEGKEFWLDAEEMLKRKLATHIFINGSMISSEDYFKNNKKGKKNDKQ